MSVSKSDSKNNPNKHSSIAVFMRGVAMGAADIVPGVSGGTIAFITGIYEELLESIQSINGKALLILLREGPAACWRYINGNFLLFLGLGIATSIIALASVISYLLANQPLLVWSFFFGLILASSIYMFKQLSEYRWNTVLAVAVGMVTAYVVTQIKPTELSPDLHLMFLSGCLAICAMIMPGISGSFILLLLGMYANILVAIKEFQWQILLSFGAGCGTGLLVFSHVLMWLFKHFHNTTLAVLTGFLIGSLHLIWPWKHTLSYYQNSKGVSLALEQENVLPTTYESIVGPPETFFAISLMIFGVIMVLSLEKFGEKAVISEKKGRLNE